MRAGMGFARPDGQHVADAAALDELAGLHHRRAENFRLGVAMQHARGFDGLEHLAGFMPIARQRLRADDMLAGAGAANRQILMKMIRHAENDQVEILAGDDAVDVGGCLGDVPFLGESSRHARPTARPRRGFPSRHVLQALQIEIADKSASQEADANGHGRDFNWRMSAMRCGSKKKARRLSQVCVAFEDESDMALCVNGISDALRFERSVPFTFSSGMSPLFAFPAPPIRGGRFP